MPLQTVPAPVITGAGVVLIIIDTAEVLLHIPLAVTRPSDPLAPVPHTTVTVDAFAAPLMVPPKAVQAYVVADGAEYENVPPLQTLVVPVIVDVGAVVTFTLNTLLVTEQPAALIVSFTVIA